MSYVDEALARVKAQNPDQPEFQQAVTEVLESLRVVIEKHEAEYRKAACRPAAENRLKNRMRTPYFPLRKA